MATGAAQHSGIDADWESCRLIGLARHKLSILHAALLPPNPMAKPKPIFNREIFRFFKDLSHHNKKTWMDVNRERYRECVVRPFRRLLEETAPAVLALDGRFDTTARHGQNFSRINRDIRFAKDKTPYQPRMYLKYAVPFAGEGETGELYAGISLKTVTAGFRIYSGSKYKNSALALFAYSRCVADASWAAKQKKRLGRKYESYWYSAEKGEWKEQAGWPTTAEDWKRLRAWIVRVKMPLAAATRGDFARELGRVFRDVYPLLRFTCLPD
jgi:uncharacterized protein (TIGR02453 family)